MESVPIAMFFGVIANVVLFFWFRTTWMKDEIDFLRKDVRKLENDLWDLRFDRSRRKD